MKSLKQNILFGIVIVLGGVKMLLMTGEYFRGALVSPIVGISTIIIGIFLILYPLLNKSKIDREEEGYFICTECQELYKKKYVEILICPKCNGRLKEQ